MCKKVNNKKVPNTRIDRCIKPLIKWLIKQRYTPILSCCGHNKYPLTVVVKKVSPSGIKYFEELFSEEIINRKRRFYKKDSEGYYYIPEVSGNSSHN